MDTASPPSAQEIQRKLSFHTTNLRPSASSRAQGPSVHSGTESDSDAGQAMPTTASDLSASLNAQPQLEVINERRVASGEETDDEDEEGEFRSANNEGDGDGVNGETVVLSGYLWKKGERRKTWKKRWFVLRTQKLAYYKNEQEYKLLRLLDLRDIHSAITVSLKHHQNTFGIVTPTRTFYIQAASTPERDNWVRRLNEVRAKLKDSIATPPIMTDTAAAAAASGVTSTATQATKAASIPVTMGASASTTTATPSRKTALRSLAKSLTPPSPNATFAFPSSISPTSASPTAAGFGITSSDSDDPFTAATTSPRAQKNKSAAQDSAQGIANDPKKVVLSGYLMKCGSKRKNWRKRWFVLTSEKLVYAKSHMDTKPHRQIPLDRILDAIEHPIIPKHSTAHPTPTSPSHTHPHAPASVSASVSSPPVVSAAALASGLEPDPAHTFKIITPKRPFLLCAPSEEEEIKWLSAVRALIARRTVPGDGAGPAVRTSASMQMGTSMSASTSGGMSAGGDARADASSSRARQAPPMLAVIADDEGEEQQHQGARIAK